jgi:hypothetical protein
MINIIDYSLRRVLSADEQVARVAQFNNGLYSRHENRSLRRDWSVEMEFVAVAAVFAIFLFPVLSARLIVSHSFPALGW